MLRFEALQAQMDACLAAGAARAANASASGRLLAAQAGSGAMASSRELQAAENEAFSMAQLLGGLLAGLPGPLAPAFAADVLAFLTSGVKWIGGLKCVLCNAAALHCRVVVAALQSDGAASWHARCTHMRSCMHVLLLPCACPSSLQAEAHTHAPLASQPLLLLPPTAARTARRFGRLDVQLLSSLNGLLLQYGPDMRSAVATCYRSLQAYVKQAWGERNARLKVRQLLCALGSSTADLRCICMRSTCRRAMHLLHLLHLLQECLLCFCRAVVLLAGPHTVWDRGLSGLSELHTLVTQDISADGFAW